MLGGAKSPNSGQGETRMVKSGDMVLEGGNQSLSHQLRVWGSAVSSHSGVRSRAAAAKRFSCILEAPSDGLSWNLLGAKFGWGGHGRFLSLLLLLLLSLLFFSPSAQSRRPRNTRLDIQFYGCNYNSC